MLSLMDFGLTVAATHAGGGRIPGLLILGIVSGIVAIALLACIVKCSRRCPTDKALVVIGKTGSARPRAHIRRVVFIWPFTQNHAYLDLNPITISLDSVNAHTADKIALRLVATGTIAISRNLPTLQNAAVRLLGLEAEEVARHAERIVEAQLLPAVSERTIDELDDRGAFLIDLNARIRPALAELGLDILSLSLNVPNWPASAAFTAAASALVDQLRQEQSQGREHAEC